MVTIDDVSLDNFTSENDLQESIWAMYSELDYQVSEKLSFKGGLRYEYTDSELNSTNGGRVVDREFGVLFPSLFLNYKIDPNNQFNLSYSKRINRPAFTDMAPFIFFLSPNTAYRGNAALQPAIANTFQLNYQWKTINIAIQYTQEDSTIAGFQNAFDLASNSQIIGPNNLSEQNVFSASLAFPIKIKDWWEMRWFGIYTYQELVSIAEEFGTLASNQNSFRINLNQTFKLPKDFSIELFGFYQSPLLDGNVRYEEMGMLNFGIQKKLKNNARLSFNIGDVFNSLKSVGGTDFSTQGAIVDRTFDFSQRTFRLTYAASFGNQKLKSSRNRTSGSAEKDRVN